MSDDIRWWIEDNSPWFIVLAVVLFIGWFISMGFKEAAVNRACLRHGWPRAEMLWDGTGYCHKRIDQTDSVIPLSKLQGE